MIFSTAFIFAGGLSTAKAAEWSFEDHPIPHISEFTKAETDFLQQADDNRNGRNPCAVGVEAEFQLYLKRYPAYGDTGSFQTLFANWKRHQVYSSNSYNACIVHTLWLKLMDLATFGDPVNFRYCGKLINPVVTKTDIAVLEILREAALYANSGSPLAIDIFLELDEDYDFVDLNPDVEYYFRKLTRSREYTEPELYDTSRLKPLLTPERIAFLDKAVQTSDLDAVIATTPPCRLR